MLFAGSGGRWEKRGDQSVAPVSLTPSPYALALVDRVQLVFASRCHGLFSSQVALLPRLGYDAADLRGTQLVPRPWRLARLGAGSQAPGALLVAPSPRVGYDLQEGGWGASHG